MNPLTPPRGRDRLPDQPGVRAARVAAIACAATMALTGCVGDQNGEEAAPTPPAETVTVTAEATAEPTPAAEPDPEPAPSECSPSDVPVATNAANIAPPLPGASWAVWRTGNLCGTLGYAELATTGGTGSSPTQLLLYSEGEFLGTGIRCNALGQVTGSTDDSVSVQYRWPIGDDSNANMRGRATVTFQWNGSSVSMLGNLPQEAMPPIC